MYDTKKDFGVGYDQKKVKKIADYSNISCSIVVRNLNTCAITHTTSYNIADKGVVSRSNCSNTLGVSQLQRATPSLVLNSFLFNCETRTK